VAEDSGSEDTKSEEIKEKKKTPDLQASPSLHDSLHDIEKTANKSADKGVTSSKTKTDASGSLKKKSKRYLIIIAFVLLVAAPFVWFWQFIPANQEGMMSRIKHFVQERFSDQDDLQALLDIWRYHCFH
jgi:Flp pilus assembly protein TadB